MTKRTPVIREVALLHRQYHEGRITFSTEYERRALWSRSAKTFLIDTILQDRPIPLIFLQRITSAQAGRPAFTVIDGQQRLRAVFEYLDNQFALEKEHVHGKYGGKRFAELSRDIQHKIENYELIVEEVSGYSKDDIQDIFSRMSKFRVERSQTELERCKSTGAFYEHIETLCQLDFWKTLERHKSTGGADSLSRLAADLTVLLIEGPQDRSPAVPLYFAYYSEQFTEGKEIRNRLQEYLKWVCEALPDFSDTRFSTEAELYSLLGALDTVSEQGKKLKALSAKRAGKHLRNLQSKTYLDKPTKQAARYAAAADKCHDELTPRMTRIQLISAIISA
ncbi:MAG: DUF262 domain-containing protein [Pseudomonadota bacterium]